MRDRAVIQADIDRASRHPIEPLTQRLAQDGQDLLTENATLQLTVHDMDTQFRMMQTERDNLLTAIERHFMACGSPEEHAMAAVDRELWSYLAG